MNYLTKRIMETKQTIRPRYGMTADGYTIKSGAPTETMIMLEHEKRWRRLMCWQFSNYPVLFVRIGGVAYIVDEMQIKYKPEGE